MSKLCARCGDLNPRRTIKPDSDWVDYLVDERGASTPVGTLVVPLCNDCYAEGRDLEGDDAHGFLDDVDPDRVIDEVAG